MPQLGMAQNSAIIVSWNKAVGDAVANGELLLEVETDKAVMEVESRHDGFIQEILGAVGSEVPVGEVIAVIAATADAATETEKEPDKAAPTLAPENNPQESNPGSGAIVGQTPINHPAQTVLKQSTQAFDTSRILASPKARRLAFERGLSLQSLVHSGITQPLHAEDIPEASVSIRQNVPTPAMLQAIASLTEIQEFLTWTNQGSDNDDFPPVCMQQVLAAFFQHSMPTELRPAMPVIRVSDHQGVQRYWKVTGKGLGSVNEIEDCERHDLDIVDFSASAITSFTPDHTLTTSTLMLFPSPSVDGSTVLLNLYFMSDTMPVKAAALWLQGIASRTSNPLCDLI